DHHKDIAVQGSLTYIHSNQIYLGRIMRLLVLILLSSISCSKAPEIKNGEDLIHAMNTMYKSKWYKTFTFEQKTSFYRNDSLMREETWLEAIKIPGLLHIKQGDLSHGNAMMFKDDTMYVFRNHQQVVARHNVHPLLVLGFDVYHDDPANTIQKLKDLGYDLSKMYSDKWQGRDVYVVGTDKADAKAKQFMIDKEHLYFVKLSEEVKTPQATFLSSTEFNKYERLGGGWVAPEVLFKRDGKVGMKEEYSKMQVPDHLDDAIFDPKQVDSAKWW
ncbi:MAG: hypothetical protein KDD94_13635, partial [Calditrichaeota bacterium]|nr:hypothetical protein [Calditrichota bacterium]